MKHITKLDMFCLPAPSTPARAFFVAPVATLFMLFIIEPIP
ncbi:hypothetical protein ACFFVU_003269 [Salmonella enterica]